MPTTSFFARRPTKSSRRSKHSGSTATPRRSGPPTAGGHRKPSGPSRRGPACSGPRRRHEPFGLNDWSFTQLCGHAGVSKETVNRSRPTRRAASSVRPCRGNKPLQLFTEDDLVRSDPRAQLHPAPQRGPPDDAPRVRDGLPAAAAGQVGGRMAAGPGSTAGSRTSSASSSTPPAGRRLTARRSLPASSSGTPRSASAQSASRPSGSRRSAAITSSGTRPRSSSSPASTRAKSARPSGTSAASSRPRREA